MSRNHRACFAECQILALLQIFTIAGARKTQWFWEGGDGFKTREKKRLQAFDLAAFSCLGRLPFNNLETDIDDRFGNLFTIDPCQQHFGGTLANALSVESDCC